MKIKNIFYVTVVLAIMNSNIHTMRPIDEQLWMAALIGQIVHVKALLANGANPNTKNSDGVPLLHKVAKHSNAEIMKLLLEHKADPNALDRNGQTPLLFATQRGNIEMVKLLLAHNANPNASSNWGWTPLHEAALSGNTEIVKLLLEHNANPNASNCNRTTPLDITAVLGHKKIIKLLLEYNADPNVADYNNETPLHMTHNKTIDAMLLLAGANIPDNLSSKRVALLDEITEEINEIIFQNNIPLFLNLHERKNQPVADMLRFLAMSRSNELANDLADLDFEITRSTLLPLPSEILRLRQQAFPVN